MNDLLDIHGVAELLGIKVSTAYVYKSIGRLPAPDLMYAGCSHWYRATIEAHRAARKQR